MSKKVIFYLTFLLIYSYSNIYSDCGSGSDRNFITSKSFFSVQPVFRPTSPESVSIRREQLRFYEDAKSTIDLTVFGGSSADPEKLARYFLPFNKTKVLIGELGSNAVKNEKVDIIANYFGILTSSPPKAGDGGTFLNNYTFESELSFKPKQIFTGIVFNYKQHISRYTDKGVWFELVIPVEYVKNEICIHEKIVKKGGPNGNDPNVPKGFVSNMKQAFKQKKWRFGKIDGPKIAIGVADPYLRFGYIYMKEETHHLNSYIGFSIPTGNVPIGEFVFEPVVGNNGHATLFIGTSGGFRIWSNCEKKLNFEFDTLGTIYAPNHQTRSLDLKDKSWSRYIWVYLDKKSTETSPGINVFSQRVKVSPGTTRDLNTAFVYKDSGFQAELGYHFFSRQSEEIKLVHSWTDNHAIAAILNKDNEFITGGISRDIATIDEYLRIKNDSVESKEIYKPIQQADLDLNSASHPSVISHTGYVTFSYNWGHDTRPKFIGLGGLYEFSSDNSALSRWMLWSRFGISF